MSSTLRSILLSSFQLKNYSKLDKNVIDCKIEIAIFFGTSDKMRDDDIFTLK
jgi:hypothetical protein